ncbi:hypothetical protein [Alteromonas sp. CYL-A6]|uniref:hypothetical protein n=1 Tax=Alteromonas nitratireducens TaxID=3390813 RepID=UPI0034C0D4E9
MKRTIGYVVSLLSLLAVAPITYALSDKAPPEPPSFDIEVIEITGERPVKFFYDIRMAKAEHFIQTFNKYVEDKDLAFECERVIRTGTRIRKTVCLSAFTWRLYEEMMKTLRAAANGLNDPTILNSNSLASAQGREYQERKRDLYKAAYEMINNNTEMARAFYEYELAEAQYKQAHVLKHGDMSKFASNQ